MPKTHSFSIYLLKSNYTAANSLKDQIQLKKEEDATALPKGAELFILDSIPKQAWWRDFFEIKLSLNQALKGAILFLPVNDRTFALTFGHVSHNLKDTSYEHDFGIRVTLNCLDPNKIKNTDTLEPSSSTRQRTQVSIDTSLTLFDFDRDSAILRSLTGKVRDEHKELIKTATGSSSLRVSSDIVSEELVEFCERILTIYDSEDYKEHFPDIRKISPVRDPVNLSHLDSLLLNAVHALSPTVTLIIPDIVDYRDAVLVGFRGARGKYVSDDIQLAEYSKYLLARGIDVAEIDIDTLKKHEIFLGDEDGNIKGPSFSIYKSLAFETELPADTGLYNFTEGSWYRIEGDYIAMLTDYLDPLYTDYPLPTYSHKTEGEYNDSVGIAGLGFQSLDRKNISPLGQTQIEPCDLVRINGDLIEFVHVKLSTQSSVLSHLFNQGANAIDILRSDERAVGKLKNLISEKHGGVIPPEWGALIDSERYSVIYAIITHKNHVERSRNLPLFSRISLYKTMRSLRARGIVRGFAFVADETDAEGLKAV
ncbi:TIGR04141 family sporadically distributed protein [Rhizobium leguminosarum]|uniref:DUF6119 family protein n=1 Tax=Rhizobium leguminosarum TaxID=384 RepID=UPI001C9794EC|nr:DUF6119 family protein [Rhizobium leguminosarum]MBY5395339.1 TIGR04141 family sporadically distributed protein [Rhizobium leguminosarum]